MAHGVRLLSFHDGAPMAQSRIREEAGDVITDDELLPLHDHYGDADTINATVTGSMRESLGQQPAHG